MLDATNEVAFIGKPEAIVVRIDKIGNCGMDRNLPLISLVSLAVWLPLVSAGVRAPCSACTAITVSGHFFAKQMSWTGALPCVDVQLSSQRSAALRDNVAQHKSWHVASTALGSHRAERATEAP